MKIFSRIPKYENTTWSVEGKTFVKAFSWTGVSFLAICLIGFLTSIIIDQAGLLKGLADVGSFDWSIYDNIAASNAIATLGKVSIASMVLVFASFILRIVWTFKIFTASKLFIIMNYLFYVLAQGLGFGMMFTIWKSTEILIVFGVAGFLFAAMALVGIKAKRLENLGYFLMAGMVAMMILSLLSMILFFTGVYANALIFVYFIVTGLLTLGYIVFDVGMLKRYAAQIDAYSDADMSFRIAAFFGFRLLTDLVTLVWMLLRLFLSVRD